MLSWNEYVDQFTALTDTQKVKHAIYFAKQASKDAYPLKDEADLLTLGAVAQDPLCKTYKDFPYDFNLRGIWFKKIPTGWEVHATPNIDGVGTTINEALVSALDTLCDVEGDVEGLRTFCQANAFRLILQGKRKNLPGC